MPKTKIGFQAMINDVALTNDTRFPYEYAQIRFHILWKRTGV